jgi:sterol 3beta-glucosyltransferase
MMNMTFHSDALPPFSQGESATFFTNHSVIQMAQCFRRNRASPDTNDRSYSFASGSVNDDVQDLIKPPNPPTLSRLFSDAALYQNVLAHCGCISQTSSESDASNDGFADLVGRDLDSSEKATATHVARLRATRYSWGSGELTEEPESYEQPNPPSNDRELKLLPSPSATLSQLEYAEADKLEPAQIVDILIEEFGSLAPDDEKEQLLSEMDGCMVSQDVFILVWFTPWFIYHFLILY